MANIINEKYEVMEKIGSGGQGIVYKGQDINTKQLYALKISECPLSTDLNKRKEELQKLEKLKHCPYVCHAHDAFLFEKKDHFGSQVSKYWCLVLTYCEQGDLRNRIL